MTTVVKNGSAALDGDDARNAIVARLERLPTTPLHRRAMSVLALGTFLDSFDTLAIASALTVIFASLHIGFVATGFLLSIGYLGQFVGALLFGVLSERWGRKSAFIISLIVMGVFCLTSAVAWDFGSLALSRALLGLGLGGEAPVAGAMIVELLQGRRRGRFFLFYQSLYVWGQLFAPIVGVVAIIAFGPQLGWRVLLGVGALSLFVAAAAQRWLPESPRWLLSQRRGAEAEAVVARFEGSASAAGIALAPPTASTSSEHRRTDFFELFSPAYRRRTVLVWLHWFLTYLVVVGTVTWLPGLFVRVAHLTVQQSLLAVVAATALELVMTYLAAAAIDRAGRKVVFSVGFAGMAAGALIGWAALSLLHVGGWLPLFVAFCAIQAFLVINATGCYLYVAELYPTRMRAWGSSSARAVSLVASMIAPLAVGALLAGPFGAAGMFALFAVLSVLGLIAFLTLGIETKGRVLEELST